jgi:hypothetical protein
MDIETPLSIKQKKRLLHIVDISMLSSREREKRREKA